MRNKIYAILLAAGIGSRTGFSLPKQLVKIKNKEIILHSLDIFLNSAINFDAIIITVPPQQIYAFDWDAFFRKNLSEKAIKKINIITGGKLRQESVYNAVKYIEKKYIKASSPKEKLENNIIFIHDSARPFVKDQELNLLLDKTIKFGAAFLFSDVTETIKEINTENTECAKKDKISEIMTTQTTETTETINAVKLKTLFRDKLISAKTPQTFRFDIIKKAVYKAFEENFISTDDVSLVENLGLPVFPVQSSHLNIKITSALDVEIAELLVKKFNF